MAELSQKKYRFGYCVRRYNYWIFGITICSISLKYTIHKIEDSECVTHYLLLAYKPCIVRNIMILVLC